MYKINEVSKKLGISAHTLRYYEREGLIHPLRDQNDRRLYTDQHLEILTFITKMRDTDMSIAKIRQFEALYLQGDETIEARRILLFEHLEFIQSRIGNLQDIEQFLQKKIENYDKKYQHVKK